MGSAEDFLISSVQSMWSVYNANILLIFYGAFWIMLYVIFFSVHCFCDTYGDSVDNAVEVDSSIFL